MLLEDEGGGGGGPAVLNEEGVLFGALFCRGGKSFLEGVVMF